MRAHAAGRILVTGSIAGFIPGSYQAVYNATKSFLNSFCFALREELEDSGVTVTCLMPGVTATDFFERADLMDTKVGRSEKASAQEVAMDGFEAMMRGDAEIISGWRNKLQVATANITPAQILAKKHAQMTAPGTAGQ
jgi:short-subunit dehydrogenase